MITTPAHFRPQLGEPHHSACLVEAKPNLTPRYVEEPRTDANTGEYPRKRWVSRDAVRPRSRPLVARDRDGPQRERCGPGSTRRLRLLAPCA
jgi:hypothetical protein